MASQLGKVLKDNAKEGWEMMSKGTIGKIFGAAAIVELATAENKLKAIGKLLKDILLMKPMIAAMGLTMFQGMSKAIQSLVKDTGSLEAMLKKLSQIQGLQNMFAPLVGGANAAKTKVAELTAFAARFNKTLEDTGNAARSLQIMTRGAFAGAQALKTVGDAAAGTNNGITAMADTMGTLYAQLRNGDAIGGTVEQMRQMGAISQSTADSLVSLQASGASASSVFSAATDALGAFNGAMDKAKDSVEGVNAAYEAAITNLQEKFASPFAAEDVENTKNMTSAMQAIAPSVERTAKLFQILMGGFSTAKSWIVQLAANFPLVRVAVEGLVDAIGILVTVLGVWGALNLGQWFGTLLPACASAGTAIMGLAQKFAMLIPASWGASKAIIGVAGAIARLAPAIATVGVVIGVVFAWASAIMIVVGVVKTVIDAINAEKKALEELRKAHDEANASMQKQIDSIKTLAGWHDALTESIQNELKAQEELNEALANGTPEQIEEAKRNRKIQEEKTQDIFNKDKSTLAPSDEANAQARASADAKGALSEAEYQRRMEIATPEQRLELRGKRKAELEERQRLGDLGLWARADEEKKRLEFAAPNEIADKDFKSAESARKKSYDKLEELKRQQSVRKDANLSTHLIDAEVEAAQKEYDSALALTKQTAAATGPANAAEKDYYENKVPQESSVALAYRLRQTQGGFMAPEAGFSLEQGVADLTNRKAAAEKLEADAQGSGQRATILSMGQDQEVSTAELETSRRLEELDAARAKSKATGLQATIESGNTERMKLDEQIALVEKMGKITGKTDTARIDSLNAQKEALLIQDERSMKESEQADYQAEIEKKKAEIKETGYAKTQAENALIDQSLQSRLKYEEDLASTSGETSGVDAVKAEIEAQNIRKSEAARAFVRSDEEVERDWQKQQAALEGDGKAAMDLENYDVFEQRRRQAEGAGFGREESINIGKNFSEGAIELKARESAFQTTGGISATDLARIGGGGNVGAGDDRMFDIAKAQKDLLASIDKKMDKENQAASNALLP